MIGRNGIRREAAKDESKETEEAQGVSDGESNEAREGTEGIKGRKKFRLCSVLPSVLMHPGDGDHTNATGCNVLMRTEPAMEFAFEIDPFGSHTVFSMIAIPTLSPYRCSADTRSPSLCSKTRGWQAPIPLMRSLLNYRRRLPCMHRGARNGSPANCFAPIGVSKWVCEWFQT
jgi:hypothetical protein